MGGLNWPARITENPEDDLSNRFGALIGHAPQGLRLSENHAGQQAENTCKQHLLAANDASCRPDSHLHAGFSSIQKRNDAATIA
ncbi:hypothetical protein EMIT0P294_90253 [Pseudomonas sp. IT-P294]